MSAIGPAVEHCRASQLNVYPVFCAALVLLSLGACGDSTFDSWMHGVSADQATIVNGTREPQKSFLTEPEILAIVFLADDENDDFCTGTLIAPRVVISAEHCIDDKTADEVFVGFGLQPFEPIASIPVGQIIAHPSIDFAILILGMDATELVDGVSFIAPNREPLTTEWLTRWVDASGYGNTYSDDTGRFFASVEIVRFDEETVTVDGHGIMGICYGDSGGPIVWQETAETAPVVVGTEQWGDSSCVDEDHLTRVDVVAPWLDEMIAELPPPLQPCEQGGEDRCEGDVHTWCAGGFQYVEDCSQQQRHCGWLGDRRGFRCLPEECGEIDYRGHCNGNILEWCSWRGLRDRDCEASGEQCILVSEEEGYECGLGDGTPDTPVDDCGDTTSSLEHCGACDTPCAPPSAIGLCTDGVCGIDACVSGYADDDQDVANGCEAEVPVSKRREPESGCSCTAAGGEGAGLALISLLLLWRRRYRRSLCPEK